LFYNIVLNLAFNLTFIKWRKKKTIAKTAGSERRLSSSLNRSWQDYGDGILNGVRAGKLTRRHWKREGVKEGRLSGLSLQLIG
jgi:hypothetical protein